MKVILLNGPPRSGKDTASEMLLAKLGYGAVFYRFASPLKHAVHALFGFQGVHEEHFTDTKNTPNAALLGFTPRDLYIWLSEQVVKPKFGTGFFGRAAVNHMRALPKDRVIVVSDCGFQEEVDILTSALGPENVFVLHIKREGTSFDGDSRGWVFPQVGAPWIIANDGNLDALSMQLAAFLKHTLPS
jgi:phosphomevalonate kinase